MEKSVQKRSSTASLRLSRNHAAQKDINHRWTQMDTDEKRFPGTKKGSLISESLRLCLNAFFRCLYLCSSVFICGFCCMDTPQRSMISSTIPPSNACSAERMWSLSGGMGSHDSGNRVRLRQKSAYQPCTLSSIPPGGRPFTLTPRSIPTQPPKA